MDPTVYFYTYSTIAQTLAGAFAFIVAVCLYQLQAIGSTLPHTASMLRNEFDNSGNKYNFDVLYYRCAWSEFIEAGKDVGIRLHAEPHRSRCQQMFSEFQQNYATTQKILKAFRFSLYPTASTIMACLALLPASYETAKWHHGYLLLAGVTLGALYCVLTFVSLVRAVVR